MATNEQKAQMLVAEAEKKLSGSKSFFSSLFGYVKFTLNLLYFAVTHTVYRGSSKLEDAVECYQRAANLFKMAKNWPQAGHAFCEAAELQAKAGSRHDAATNYVDAANCYKKTDINGGCFKINITV